MVHAPPSPSSSRVRAMALPLVAAVVVAWPLFVFRYPPMTDFASHESLVWLLRHRGDASLYPPGLYGLNLGHPNQLTHLLAWALSFVFGVHLGLKIVVALAIAAILHAASRLARYLEVTPWSALFVTPVAVGFTFYFGFVTNLVGIAALLYALPAIDRFVASPDGRGALRAAGWIVVLYFAHESLLFVLVGAIGLFAILRATSLRALALVALPILLAAGIVVTQAHAQEPLRSRASLLTRSDFGTIRGKFGDLAHVAFGGFDPMVHAVLALLLVLGIALMWHGAPRDRRDEASSVRERLAGHRFVLLGVACVVLYFAMPSKLNGASLVNTRYLPVAIALLVVALAPRVGARLGVVIAACVPLAVLASVVPQYALADRAHAELDVVMAHIEKDSAVANLDAADESPDVAFRPTEFASRVLEDRGGRLLNSFADSPIAPVLLAPALRWDEALARSNLQTLLFRPAVDLRRFRYVLLRTNDEELAKMIAGALSPEARFVARRGGFYLFESTILALPLTAPESPSPILPTETLLTRLRDRFHVPLEVFDVRIDDLAPLRR